VVANSCARNPVCSPTADFGNTVDVTMPAVVVSLSSSAVVSLLLRTAVLAAVAATVLARSGVAVEGLVRDGAAVVANAGSTGVLAATAFNVVGVLAAVAVAAVALSILSLSMLRGSTVPPLT
jgi:hypothetical protein